MTPQNEVLLNVDSAMKLGQVHSPDYRQQIETLYLSALDVSAERFRFDTQFFGGTGLGFAHQGRNRVPAVGEQNTALAEHAELHEPRRHQHAGDAALGTGGELLVGFATRWSGNSRVPISTRASRF